MTRVISLAVWTVIIVGIVVLEYRGLRGDRRIPTAGDLLSTLMRPRVGRWFVLLGWVWLGWHSFVR